MSNKSKSFRYKLILGILGCNDISLIPGISKYDISVKTIILEKGGNLVESIPLIKVDNSDICREFYDSSFYYEITKPVIYVIFKKTSDNTILHDIVILDILKDERILKNAEIVYNHTRRLYLSGNVKEVSIKNNIYNFKKISDNLDFHVRPKALNSNDTYITPYGERITKQAF